MTRLVRLDAHLTIVAARAAPPTRPDVLDAAELRVQCLAADVGFVEIERPALADHSRQDLGRLAQAGGDRGGAGPDGHHRNVIHPRFGNFVLPATLVIDTPVSTYDRPLDYDPCLECKLCVAACPTGAISKTGEFDFAACAAHSCREFLTGFRDWVENVASSSGPRDHREKVSDPETVSMWQSRAFGPQYKAAYCGSVCPADEDVIGPYLADRRAHLDGVVRPLQGKVETAYLVARSDAEAYVPRRFPHKRVLRAGLGIRPSSIESFVVGMPLLFQRNAATRLDARYHLVFSAARAGR